MLFTATLIPDHWKIVNPCGLTVFNVAGFAPPHEVTRPAHASNLVGDIAERGWHGPPLLAMSNHARSFTGSHRTQAAIDLGMKFVPGVEIEDLLAAYNLDLEAELANGSDLDDAVGELSALLPGEIQDTYGVDFY